MQCTPFHIEMENSQDHQAERYCHDIPWWTEAVAVITSVQTYERVVHYMFEGGKINEGRLQVLKVLTQDVCNRYPHLAPEIWNRYYTTVLSRPS